MKDEDLKCETVDTPRPVIEEMVGSEDRGSSVLDLISRFETAQPDLGMDRRLSSASLRAGMLVRMMRGEAGFSQAQLAAKVGVTQARISEIERGLGAQGPTWIVMERIAEACGSRWLPCPKPGQRTAKTA